MRYSNTDSSSHEPVSVNNEQVLSSLWSSLSRFRPLSSLAHLATCCWENLAILRSYPRLAVQIPMAPYCVRTHPQVSFLGRPSWERLPRRCFVDLCLRHDHSTLISIYN